MTCIEAIDRAGALEGLLKALPRIPVDLVQQGNAVDRVRAMVLRGPVTPSHIMTLEGEAGVGKTRVIDVLCGVVQSELSAALDAKVLRITCLSALDGRALNEALCSTIGIAPLGGGRPSRATTYLIKQMQIRSYQVLIIENAHLLVLEEYPRAGVLDVLGSVVAAGTCPLALVGRKGTSILSKHLMECVGQQSEDITLLPFPWNSGIHAIADFLGLVAEHLRPFIEPLGIALFIHDENTAKRFWAGSAGFPGAMIAILRETLRAVSAKGERRKLKAADFGEAWRIFYATKSRLGFNPFTRDDPPGLGDIAALRSGS